MWSLLRYPFALFTSFGLLLPHGLSCLQKAGTTYDAPLKNFSLVIPALPFGTTVQKANTQDTGTLSCLGAAGDVRRIDYQRFPPDFTPPSDSTAVRMFAQGALQSMLAANPGTILSEEALQIDGQDAWFAMVTFFKAARSVDASGQRLDATRGVLIFARNGFAYSLHVERGPPWHLDAALAKELLTTFYRGITFH